MYVLVCIYISCECVCVYVKVCVCVYRCITSVSIRNWVRDALIILVYFKERGCIYTHINTLGIRGIILLIKTLEKKVTICILLSGYRAREKFLSRSMYPGHSNL